MSSPNTLCPGQGSSRLDAHMYVARCGVCLPASCPTRSFGPLPPATCLPPGGCVLRGIFALPFFVRRKLGVLCASASKSSKQIRRALTAMHRKVWGCRVGRSAVCPAQGQTERADELREARLHRGQARARGDRSVVDSCPTTDVVARLSASILAP